MTGLLLWLRRGAGPALFVALMAFLLTAQFSQMGWRREYDWASRFSAASVLLTSPCVAAVAAFDTARLLSPTIAAALRSSRRSRAQIVLPAAAIVAWSTLAYVVTWSVAGAVVAFNSGIGVTDSWVFPEVIAPLLGAGLVGLLVGISFRPRWAAPVAAVVVLTGAVASSHWGRGSFEALTTSGTLTGLERPAVRAVAAIAAPLVIGVSALVAARVVFAAPHRRTPALVATAAMVVAASIAPAAWPWRQGVMVPTTEAYACIGAKPEVCAPKSRVPLLVPVQESLAKAYVTLAGTDFTRPTSFRVDRLDHYSQLNGAAPLDFQPEAIHDNVYDNFAVARALIRPHQCRELFDAAQALPVLQSQDVVLAWLQAALRGQTPPRPVPADVQAAFKVTLDCRVMTGDLH